MQKVFRPMRKFMLLTAFLAVWHIASTVSTPIFIPGPMLVFTSFLNLLQTGQLIKGLGYSFSRITVAAFLSMGIAIPTAILIYGIGFLKEALMPVISFLRYIPVTAFSPLLVLWCGIGEKMKISFLFIATFVYFLPSVLLCFDEVPAELLDVGRSLGLQERHIISQVVLPMSLPSICNTFLMMYGIGWTYCAIVEASNAKYGLGYIIEISAARGRTSIVFAAIIMIMIFSHFFDKLGNWLIHKIFSWRY